jgi:hypothetical protein
VCSITHGAILVAADGGLETAAPCWLPTAREEAMAPTAAIAAAPKNSEQKIRRHLDAVNVGVGFEFVIMEVAGVFGLFDWPVERKPEPPLVDKAQAYVKPFLENFTFEARTRRLLDKREEVSAINFALPARRVRKVLDSRTLSELGVRFVFASLSAGLVPVANQYAWCSAAYINILC